MLIEKFDDKKKIYTHVAILNLKAERLNNLLASKRERKTCSVWEVRYCLENEMACQSILAPNFLGETHRISLSRSFTSFSIRQKHVVKSPRLPFHHTRFKSRRGVILELYILGGGTKLASKPINSSMCCFDLNFTRIKKSSREATIFVLVNEGDTEKEKILKEKKNLILVPPSKVADSHPIRSRRNSSSSKWTSSVLVLFYRTSRTSFC